MRVDDDAVDETTDEPKPSDHGSKGAVVSAVDRAMTLLTLLSERRELGVTEAAIELGVAPSTAARLLTTMAGHGFVEQGPNRRYRPGSQLAANTKHEGRIAHLASTMRPVLRELYEELGETVHLVMLTGQDTQFIDGIEATRSVRTGLRIGARVPAYCTAGGKAILAEFDDVLVDTILGGELQYWPSQRISTLEQLHTELGGVRVAGFACNFGESARGVHAIGVAVSTSPRHPAAAITVSVPTERFTPADRKHIVNRLRRARERAEALLRA